MVHRAIVMGEELLAYRIVYAAAKERGRPSQKKEYLNNNLQGKVFETTRCIFVPYYHGSWKPTLPHLHCVVNLESN